MNRLMNYLNTVEHFQTKSADRRELQKIFAEVLHGKVDIANIPTADRMEHIWGADFSRGVDHDIDPSNFINNYLDLVRKTLSAYDFSKFLRYLSVYLTGRISHEMFVRLFLELFDVETVLSTKVGQLLPAFLACFNMCSFHSEEMERTSEEDQVIEIVTKMTASFDDPKIAESVSKCLKCLATGLISKEDAEKWLSTWIKEDIVKELLSLSDMRLNDPARLPHEVILAPGFSNSETYASALTQFVEYRKRYAEERLNGFLMKDFLRWKLRGLRKLAKSLNHTASLDPEQLLILYEITDVDELVKVGFSGAPVVMNRIATAYMETHNYLEKYYLSKMKDPSDTAYRYAFTGLMEREFVSFPYLLPGDHYLTFPVPFRIVFAILSDFITTYFKDPELEKLRHSLKNLRRLFAENGPFVVSEKVVLAVVYLAKISSMIDESGPADTIAIKNSSVMNCPQTSPYAMKFVELPRILQSTESSLADLFGNSIMRHVDLVFARFVRALNEICQQEAAIEKFPDFFPDTLMTVTMQKQETENGLQIVCRTLFCPFIE